MNMKGRHYRLAFIRFIMILVAVATGLAFDANGRIQPKPRKNCRAPFPFAASNRCIS
jgi:hypothetical protein